MGTPDFSVPALKAILNSEHNISLVVTQPDRPKGRGRKVTPSPVKQVAKKFGIEVIQPENINNPLITKQLKALNPDLFVVVAFGQKLSKEILNIPTIYPVNIHASLLPQYRGSSPIQAAITNLDKTTGVTTMIMGESLDTGDILLTSTTDILSMNIIWKRAILIAQITIVSSSSIFLFENGLIVQSSFAFHLKVPKIIEFARALSFFESFPRFCENLLRLSSSTTLFASESIRTVCAIWRESGIIIGKFHSFLKFIAS